MCGGGVLYIHRQLTLEQHGFELHGSTYMHIFFNSKQDFPGGAVVKNLPANARDTGSSPGPGRSHVPRSN